MNIAYLIFAYKNPILIKKLIECLSCENSSFHIHIDKKSNLNDFSIINGANVYFSENRIPVYWAEYSGIRAILILIRQALNSAQIYDYLVLLSGSEYPLKSMKYIHNFLELNRGTEFINLVKMPNMAAGKPISRINTLRLQSDKPILRFIVRVLAKLGFAQRNYKNYLGTLEAYAGNTWWALTRDACQYIINFAEKNPNIVRYFENTFAPEEMFIHTILGNSSFRSRIRRNLVYEDWSSGGGHPAMLVDKHIAYFETNQKIMLNDVYGKGEVLFARKYSDENINLVKKVDDIITQREKKK